jgi:hypothetical protein
MYTMEMEAYMMANRSPWSVEPHQHAVGSSSTDGRRPLSPISISTQSIR